MIGCLRGQRRETVSSVVEQEAYALKWVAVEGLSLLESVERLLRS